MDNLHLTRTQLMTELQIYVELVGFVSDDAGPYFNSINSQLELLKKSITKASFNVNTLTPAAIQRAVETASLNSEIFLSEQDSKLRGDDETTMSPGIELNVPSDFEVEARGTSINQVAGTTSNAYEQFIRSNLTTGNATQDAAIKLMAAILKYDQEILVEKQVRTYSEKALKYIEYSYSFWTPLLPPDLKEVSILSDKLQEYLDYFQFNDDNKFIPSEYFSSLVRNIINGYDVAEKASLIPSGDKVSLEDLFALMRLNESQLPPEIKKYSHIYKTTDIDYLLTDEAEDLNKLLVELENAGLSKSIEETYKKVSVNTKDLVTAFSGGVPQSMVDMNQAILQASQNIDSLPEDIRSTFNEIGDLNSFQEALKSGAASALAPYTNQLSSLANQFKNLTDISELPQQLVGSLASLSNNAPIDLSNLVNFPSGSCVSDVVGKLIDMKSQLPSIDTALASIVDGLPSNIKNLNLSNLTDLLSVNTQLSSLFDRINVLDQFGGLPTSIKNLTSSLPAGVGNMFNSLNDIVGVDKVLNEVKEMINVGNITKPVQDAINKALGGLSTEGVLDIIKTGDMNKITDIAGNLSGIVGNLGSLSELPTKVMETLGNIPSKIGDIAGNIGGLVSNLDMSKLGSMAVSNLGPMLMQALPPEAQKIAQVASQILSLFGFDFGFGGLFGGGSLGSPVPRPWW